MKNEFRYDSPSVIPTIVDTSLLRTGLIYDQGLPDELADQPIIVFEADAKNAVRDPA